MAATLIRLPSEIQDQIAHAVRSSVLKPLLWANGTLTRTEARARDFDVLRAQMDSVVTSLVAQGTLAEENRQLRGLLELKERSPSRFVAATVVRASTFGSESVFHLDVGARDGIGRFGSVITEGGLLGQVQEVRASSATGFDWSHIAFRVSAMTPDGEFHGLVEPDRGAFREQDRLIMRGTVFLSDLEPGTEIITSGRGGTFPRGIRIGRIASVAETSQGWSKSYYLNPAVHPGSVTFALVEVEITSELTAPPDADTGDVAASMGALNDGASETRFPPEANSTDETTGAPAADGADADGLANTDDETTAETGANQETDTRDAVQSSPQVPNTDHPSGANQS